MREVSVFYSFDDREFFDRDECFTYEEKALKKFQSFNYFYTFYDKDMNIMYAPMSKDVEEWINWLQCSAGKCSYIRRMGQLPEEVNQFIREEAGYCILNEDFNNEIGLFKYDDIQYEWIKVEDN